MDTDTIVTCSYSLFGLLGSVVDDESNEIKKTTSSRSKRTCVRVREEITKLHEILDTSGGGGGVGVAKGSTNKATKGQSGNNVTHIYSNPYVGKKRGHTSQLSGKRSRRQSEGLWNRVNIVAIKLCSCVISTSVIMFM